jgi:hypothetical protein
MAAKLPRMTHKIVIQLQRTVSFAVLATGGQSGNFSIHLHIKVRCVYVGMRHYGKALEDVVMKSTALQ